ncbi:MAG: hypothetical protein EB127_02410 [Alphaproteobacteria bacterium]|nr:hypothetical protein [Alphaproteobacteria bacterium]
METVTIVFRVMTYILLILALYYLYKFLYGNSWTQKDIVVYSASSHTNGMPSNNSNVTTLTTSVPQLYPGGEYSISTWVYVNSWTTTTNKPFLTLSGGGSFKSLVLFLGQRTNKLGVRISTTSPSNPPKLNASEMAKIISNSPMTPYSDNDTQMCDIESVDLQKWVNVTVVLMGKTVDVYMDGKLARSCVYGTTFDADGNTPTITLGGPNSFSGYIGLTRAANFAYSPDIVYSHYQQGPFAGFSLSSLNPFSYDLTLSSNGSTIFSTSNE